MYKVVWFWVGWLMMVSDRDAPCGITMALGHVRFAIWL